MSAASVRTEGEPMAFTGGEFMRGALTAAVAYLAIVLLVFLLSAMSEATQPGMTLIVLTMVLAYGLPIALLAMLVGAGPAYAIGRTLRSVRPVWIHLSVFAAYGALVAGATVGVLALTGFPFLSAGGPLGVLLFVAPGMIAVPTGWWHAYRTAIRIERRGRRRPRHDPDAAE